MAEVENNGMRDVSAIIENFLRNQKAGTQDRKLDNSRNELPDSPAKNNDESLNLNSEDAKLKIPSQEEINTALEKAGNENFSEEEIIQILNGQKISKEQIIKYLSAENGYLRPLKNNGFNFIDIEI